VHALVAAGCASAISRGRLFTRKYCSESERELVREKERGREGNKIRIVGIEYMIEITRVQEK
jgi:hypothetical protein